MYNQTEVHQYTLGGHYLHTYESVSVAAFYMEVNPSSICKAIRKHGTCKGFLWARNRILSKKE